MNQILITLIFLIAVLSTYVFAFRRAYLKGYADGSNWGFDIFKANLDRETYLSAIVSETKKRGINV